MKSVFTIFGRVDIRAGRLRPMSNIVESWDPYFIQCVEQVCTNGVGVEAFVVIDYHLYKGR